MTPMKNDHGLVGEARVDLSVRNFREIGDGGSGFKAYDLGAGGFPSGDDLGVSQYQDDNTVGPY